MTKHQFIDVLRGKTAGYYYQTRFTEYCCVTIESTCPEVTHDRVHDRPSLTARVQKGVLSFDSGHQIEMHNEESFR